MLVRVRVEQRTTQEEPVALEEVAGVVVVAAVIEEVVAVVVEVAKVAAAVAGLAIHPSRKP